MSSLLLSSVLFALAPAAPPAAAPSAAAPSPAPPATLAAPTAAAPTAMGPVAAAPAVVIAPAAPPPNVVIVPSPPVAAAPSAGPVTVTVNVYPPVAAPVAAPPVVAVAGPVPVGPPPALTAPAFVPPQSGPNPVMVQQSIRKFRRGAAGMLVLSSAGAALTLGLQAARLAALDSCTGRTRRVPDDVGFNDCAGAEMVESGAGVYGALGIGVFATAVTSSAAMFGKAAAHRDVQLRNGALKSRRPLKVMGVITTVAASAWLVSTYYGLASAEAECSSADCQMQYRPLRYAATDVGAIGLTAGTAMLGYAVAYGKQGKALMSLRPAVGRTNAGLSLSGRF